MPSSMQPGRAYRLREQGKLTFRSGEFKDGVFYEVHGGMPTGSVDAEGMFINCKHDEQFPRRGNNVAGRVKGLILESIDGRRFELVHINS